MNDWIYHMGICPLDTKVRLLSADNNPYFQQMEFVGTITLINGVYLMQGKCYEGDPNAFYRSEIIAWKEY